jgi:hypothetical protein
VNCPSGLLTIGHSTLAAAARMIDGQLSYAAARVNQQQLPF